jgi:serine/threonine protein kinase
VSGLDVLHKNDYIHGNIKPSNILIYKGGIIKISDFDFGISKKSFSNKTKCSVSNEDSERLLDYLFIYLYIFIYLHILY